MKTAVEEGGRTSKRKRQNMDDEVLEDDINIDSLGE
jgi:hypothetical protein